MFGRVGRKGVPGGVLFLYFIMTDNPLSIPESCIVAPIPLLAYPISSTHHKLDAASRLEHHESNEQNKFRLTDVLFRNDLDTLIDFMMEIVKCTALRRWVEGCFGT